jgi:hypothetical protein
MDKLAIFEKKIMQLIKNRNLRNFATSHGAVGAGVGALGGGALGAIDTARKQIGGELEGMSAGDVAKTYLNNIAGYGGTGALAGGTLGLMRGSSLKNNIIKKQLGEVEAALKGGTGAQKLYENLVRSGKVRDLDVLEHLHGSNNMIDQGMNKIMGMFGQQFDPAAAALAGTASRENLRKSLGRYISTGDVSHLAELTPAEREMLTRVHGEAKSLKGNPAHIAGYKAHVKDRKEIMQDFINSRGAAPERAKFIKPPAVPPPPPKTFHDIYNEADARLQDLVAKAPTDPSVRAQIADAAKAKYLFDAVKNKRSAIDQVVLSGPAAFRKSIKYKGRDISPHEKAIIEYENAHRTLSSLLGTAVSHL